MTWPKFVVGNVVGALCWAPTLLLVGYLAASLPWPRQAALAVAVPAVATMTLVGGIRWLRAGRAA
jgi:membrane protein DedA with SNARE-associated domain